MNANTNKHCSTCKCGSSGQGFSQRDFLSQLPPEPPRVDTRPQEIRDAESSVEALRLEYNEVNDLYFDACLEEGKRRLSDVAREAAKDRRAGAQILLGELEQRLRSALVKYHALQKQWSQSGADREIADVESRKTAALHSSHPVRIATLKKSLAQRVKSRVSDLVSR